MPRPPTDSQRINIFVPNEDLKWYRDKAKREGETYSAVIRRAMRAYKLATERREAKAS